MTQAQTHSQLVTFTLKNDSEVTIVLYVGKTQVSVQAKASYKFTKAVGTTIFWNEFEDKKILLLTVRQDLEGKKLNFSELLKDIPKNR